VPGSAPPTPAAVEVAADVIQFLSLSLPLGIGMAVGALAIPEDRGGLVSRWVRSLTVPAALIVLLGAALQLHSAAQITATALIEFAALVLAAGGLLAMRWTPSRLLARGVLIAAVLAVMIPKIPLAPTTLTRMVSTALTTVHLLGAMTWVGGLAALAATGIVMRRSALRIEDQDGVAADWSQIWQRFSMVALVAVGALIVSGTWLAWSHVGAPSQFLTTPYGRFLGVKLILVLTLLGAGAYNVRVLLPRIHTLQADGDSRSLFRLAAQHFPSVVLGEAVLALAILTIVPFLHGSARAQAGQSGAVAFDMSTFATGVGLVILVAVLMWAGARRSFRPLQPSRPGP